MMSPTLSSFKLSWKHIAVSLLVVIYIAVNIFRTGGDAFVLNLNNNIVHPLGIGITLLALELSRKIEGRSRNRRLWQGLFIGWALWTVAQLYWAIAAIIGQEIPYPSWADFFWIVGYIPMYIALWERLRSLPQMASSAQKMGIWISSLFIVICTVWFVLIPIVQNNDPSAILESVLNILYPLTDVVLLILVLQIFLIYQPGSYGIAWIWLSAGFILMTLSDLIFSYATTAGLYYPDGQANLLSTIGVDVPYNVSYLLWLIGLFILQSIQRSHHAIENIHTLLTLVPNTHLLIFTYADDTVMDVSKNYARVFSENMVKGKTIQEVLGISPEDTDALLKDIKANKILKERRFLANTRLGQEQVWVSGIVIFSPQGEYSGVYLLLRMLAKDHSLDKLSTDHEKAMISSILSKTGTKQKEEEDIKQLLANYYRAFLQGLYNRVFDEGGSIMADIFLTKLQSVSKQHEWQVIIQPKTLLDVNILSLSETQEALPVLLETATQFIIEIIGESNVNMIVQDVRSKFDEFTLRNISHFELIKQERT
jgi:hypothetical protein